jgi:hypothetical protein
MSNKFGSSISGSDTVTVIGASGTDVTGVTSAGTTFTIKNQQGVAELVSSATSPILVDVGLAGGYDQVDGTITIDVTASGPPYSDLSNIFFDWEIEGFTDVVKSASSEGFNQVVGPWVYTVGSSKSVTFTFSSDSSVIYSRLLNNYQTGSQLNLFDDGLEVVTATITEAPTASNVGGNYYITYDNLTSDNASSVTPPGTASYRWPGALSSSATKFRGTGVTNASGIFSINIVLNTFADDDFNFFDLEGQTISIKLSQGTVSNNSTVIAPTNPILYEFNSFTITIPNHTPTGNTLAQMKTYTVADPITWLDDTTVYASPTNGFIRWLVPKTATYRIRCEGAAGGYSGGWGQGGLGGMVQAEFDLTLGSYLWLAVGSRGDTNYYDTGGGGGTFCGLTDGTITTKPVESSMTWLLVAGGAGGMSASGFNGTGSDAGGANGSDGAASSTSWASGGSLGAGGGGVSNAGGGGGAKSDGTGNWPGRSWDNNLQTTSATTRGGFGGGGGFSGGAAAPWSYRAGGGGNYVNKVLGSNFVSTPGGAAFNYGRLIITMLE